LFDALFASVERTRGGEELALRKSLLRCIELLVVTSVQARETLIKSSLSTGRIDRVVPA